MKKLKISPVRKVKRYEDDPKYLLQLIVRIFIAIEDTRKRKKRPSREVILRAECDRHGLVNSVVSDTLDLLIELKTVYIKHDNKGNDSLFINTESRDEIFDALNKASGNSRSQTVYQDHRPWQENQDARLLLHDVIVINDDHHLTKTVENSEETVSAADSFELNGMRNQKSGNLDHNIISGKGYQESENLDHNIISGKGKFYTVIQSLCDQLSFERKVNYELQNQNFILLEKLSKLEKELDQQVTSKSHEDLSKKGDSATMVEEQRLACLNERHRKYEQYCIEQKLCNSKEQASQARVNKEPYTQKQHNRKGKEQSLVNQSCKNPSPSLLDQPEPKLGAKNIKKTIKTSVNESNSKLNTKSCTTEQRNVNKLQPY